MNERYSRVQRKNPSVETRNGARARRVSHLQAGDAKRHFGLPALPDGGVCDAGGVPLDGLVRKLVFEGRDERGEDDL